MPVFALRAFLFVERVGYSLHVRHMVSILRTGDIIQKYFIQYFLSAAALELEPTC